MHRHRRRLVLYASTVCTAAALLAGLVVTAWVGAVPGATAGASNAPVFSHACGAPAAGFASCHAIRNDSKPGGGGPSGLNPVDLQSAYKLSATGGTGHTVAIADAFHDPNAASDLSTYHAQFGLPLCTT